MGDPNEEEIRLRKMDAYGTQKDKESEKNNKDPLTKEQQKRQRSFVIYIPKKLFYLSLLIGLIALIVTYVPRRYFLPFDEENPYAALGEEGLKLFRKYDRNGDDQLSISEYESLFFQMLGNGLNLTEFEYNPEQEIEEDDQFVTMRAYFTPLVIETMTKDLEESYFGNIDSLSGLKEWTKLNHEWMNFGVRHFTMFFPKERVQQGHIYDLYTEERSFMSSMSAPHLSSNRFYPSKIDDKLIGLYRILSMFHPRPFLMIRFPPKGGVAMVRAQNDDYIEIVLELLRFWANSPETSLESSSVISLLEERFISNWNLVVDLKEFEKDSSQPEIQKIAAHFMENYKFPVMMYVTFPNGTIVHKVNANDYMDQGEGFMQNPYAAFLKTGIANAEKMA
ncbi:SEPN1 [Mytilus edulis]|uniref:SEPN1 n=1 Tax=Mytilus edulis TaxID=6550 RepID=A0A8S3QL80_MYTED|nr:SEPN1 [Mytilus edulis]